MKANDSVDKRRRFPDLLAGPRIRLAMKAFPLPFESFYSNLKRRALCKNAPVFLLYLDLVVRELRGRFAKDTRRAKLSFKVGHRRGGI